MFAWLAKRADARPAAPAAGGGADAAGSAARAAPVYILRDDGLVRLADGLLLLTAQGAREETVRLDEVAQLSLFGAAGITSPCLAELMRRGIPVVWRSAGGRYVGQAADLSGRPSAVRRAQYRTADDAPRSLAIACALVRAKIANQRGIVRRSGAAADSALRELQRLAGDAGAAASTAALLGMEGAASAAYYSVLRDMIAPARRGNFAWDGRRRRPPTDPLNCLLSYLYAIVCGECAAAALAAGFDPAVGFLHSERPGRPALALDLMEPFRPVVADAVALAAINRGELRAEHFVSGEAGVRLADAGRRALLAALERRWSEAVSPAQARGASLTLRDAVGAQAQDLARALKSGGPFQPFERR